MTKVGYKPNIIVKYHADKKIHLFNDDNVNKIIQELYIYIPYGISYVSSNTVLVNNNFDYGIGYWEIYSQICKVDNIDSLQYGKKLIGLFCGNKNSITFYENDEYITYINMNINTLEDEDVYFICGCFKSLNLNKLILPNDLLYFNYANPFDETNLQKIIIPPNVNIDSNNGYFKNKYGEYIDTIFTSYEVPKLGAHYGGVIKCPPNLVDKYKEYYPDAVAANNILYIKKRTQDTDKNINFNNRDVDNELYITKNYTDDGYTEINIINYDDFKDNNASVDINGNNIVDVIFPESITSLDVKFIGKNLTKLIIPKNVTKISNNFFNYLLILEENLINLSSLDITTMNFYNDKIVKNGIEENGCVIGDYIFNNTLYKNTLFGVRDIFYKNIIIPEYVEVIKSNAFYSSKINYVFISKNINTINPVLSSNIFSYTDCVIEVSIENKKYDSRNNCNAVIETQTNKLVCGNKLSVIPDSVKIIGNSALDNTDFDILDLKNVESVLTNAFNNSFINKLILNNTITNIGNHAFYHIKNVIYKGTIEEWNNIYISSTAFRTGTIIHCVDGDITYN